MGDCYNLTNVHVFIQHSVNNHPTLTYQIFSTVMVGVQYFPLLGLKRMGTWLSPCSETVVVTICQTTQAHHTYGGILHKDC